MPTPTLQPPLYLIERTGIPLERIAPGRRRRFRLCPGPLLKKVLTAVILSIGLFGLTAPTEGADRLNVKIDGIGGEMLENVRAYLTLLQASGSLTEQEVRRLYRLAPGEIEQSLQALGHYRPKIRSELTKVNEGWLVEFEVDPGAAVRIARIDLNVTGAGESDPPFQEIWKQVPIREGDVLHHGRYEEAKKNIQALAAERGYFDARFSTSRLEVDPEQNRAEVVLHFDTGRRYLLGEVLFNQNEFDPEFLSRFASFRPGDPYHTRHLLLLQNTLSDSDYFETVEVRLLTEQEEAGQVPVQVTLTARKKFQLSGGLGYGTDTGPRIRAGWENRRVNLSGHRFRTELELSQLRQNLTAVYEIPLEHPPVDKLELQAGGRHEETDTAESTLATAGVARTTGRSKGWVETVFLNYQTERFEVGDQTGRSRLLLPGISWTRTLADRQTFPRRGSRITLGVKGTTEWLGSDIGLLQNQLQGKIIRAFGEKGRVIVRGDFGWSRVSDFSGLPASLRFFAGGDRSIRGYGYNTLGPTGETGEVIGGRYLAVGSVEYDHRIFTEWSAALFYDAGNAFNEWDHLDVKQGVGIGARWHSPVGPVRLDLAYAVDRPGIAIRLHFNMGPDL